MAAAGIRIKFLRMGDPTPPLLSPPNSPEEKDLKMRLKVILYFPVAPSQAKYLSDRTN